MIDDWPGKNNPKTAGIGIRDREDLQAINTSRSIDGASLSNIKME